MRQTLRSLIFVDLLLDFLNFVRNCTAAVAGNGTNCPRNYVASVKGSIWNTDKQG